METKNQIKLLVFSCLVILAGLVAIQYYLIQNTYKLTSETYVSEVKKTITPVVESPEIDTLEDRFLTKIKLLCLERAKDSISYLEFNKRIRFLSDSVSKASEAFIQSQIVDYPILKEIKIRSKIKMILFETNGVYDTILRLTDAPIVYIGSDFKGKPFVLNKGTTYSTVDTETENPVEYFYKHYQESDMDISNFQQKIWGKMMWMLIAAISLILAVILLFFWMYRSLIKQKKIAEIRTDFANNITHELKTPMTSLALIIRSFKNEEIIRDPEKRNELIASLERQNLRIQNITDKVLESSMKQKADFQKRNIVTFLNELSSDFKSTTHVLKTEINPEDLTVKTDFHQLERVIQNVLENAQKYSPHNSEIVLRSYSNDSHYIIEIQDHGKGISTKEQKKIFDKFYRVAEGNQHNTKGLGLGLYLSCQIMKSLGGTIVVNSKLGEGSTFILKIPAQ